MSAEYEKYNVGDELDVRIMPGGEKDGLLLTVPKLASAAKENGQSYQ